MIRLTASPSPSVAPDVTRTDAEASAVELDEVDESATVEQENEKD